ncbi:cAMP-binding domain of CRP or a regulatory subunit of cAMP-dependent protein kinases [Salinimicrobium catena]|uniref:cAMP-binding domain of CRP or a regulatory subunit of cAMP-dependent protein kinases n=1 Tax=Salinimicrobium catena TaxID=390640 RepID=A0A1H5MZL2_9FLAO|nr:response regulator [Salinimicrobium catena]SDL33175.1 cAMP-binding domain of CRP or a regulatory subunit of cAMP-dependent protein kinases [Salinimicrobium catena]SEE94696.1 cAMP-binding domain of CRP or a regulatory subunit of cAMP-dependent protein kinases [Salinimicrobium catena]
MKKSVLLIEDDTTLRENTRELLEFSGYRVFTAENGKIGVDRALEKVPDIIVCDIKMPQLDGYGVYEALCKSRTTREIPFIFLSVKAEPEDIRRGMNLGADDYLTKPFRETDLLNAIASRLAKRAILKKRGKTNLDHTGEVENLEELRTYFTSYGESIQIEKHEELFRETRHASYVYLVDQGLVKCFRLDEYGKELITGISKKDDFLGFYSFKVPGQYPETAEALEETTLFRISSEEFIHTLLQSQNLTVEFAQLISENLSIMKTHLLDMAYSSVLKKTTNTILEFAENIQGDPQQFIRISRSDLASVAGISTESFIRSLSSLKKEGLIDIVGRDIKILNLQKLHTIR